MADRHHLTGEWIPPAGFPRLPEPDGRELRVTLAAAALLRVTPPYMSTLAKREGLTIYTARTSPGGSETNYYLLEELLALKAKKAGYEKLATGDAHPTEFTLKQPSDEA